MQQKFPFHGALYNGNRIFILIHNGLSAYQRDITLFHEMGHFFYDKSKMREDVSLEEMEIILEYHARMLRADPQLLRHAVYSFGLKPEIYDCASYRAFGTVVVGLENQLNFKFAEGDFDFKVTLMD